MTDLNGIISLANELDRHLRIYHDLVAGQYWFAVIRDREAEGGLIVSPIIPGTKAGDLAGRYDLVVVTCSEDEAKEIAASLR
jgi:hypothetical protein